MNSDSKCFEVMVFGESCENSKTFRNRRLTICFPSLSMSSLKKMIKNVNKEGDPKNGDRVKKFYLSGGRYPYQEIKDVGKNGSQGSSASSYTWTLSTLWPSWPSNKFDTEKYINSLVGDSGKQGM